MSDEGFGVHFVRWFSKRHTLPKDVRIIEGGTMGYALLDPISKCEHLIVIDVLKVDDEPGSIYKFSRHDIEAVWPPPTSAHEVTFQDVLFKAELLDECPVVTFLCIIPKNYLDMSLEMTDELKNKLPAMEDLLIRELALHGIEAKKSGHA